MLEDRYGNSLSTASSAARDAYVDGVDRLLAASFGAEAAFEAAAAHDPDFALAHIARARSLQMLGKAGEVAAPLGRAREAATRHTVTAREARHLAVMGAVLEGKGYGAYGDVRAHLSEYPRDAMIAQTCMGVFGLIGFSGEAGRESEQLAFSSWLAPHYGDDWWFLSQHAFAQLESGRTGPAEDSIERSLLGNPRSGNGAHVRAHLYYENGETDAGLAYLADWRRDYAKESLLHCHVSWHVALWSLETGDLDAMWAVVDADVAPDAALGPPINIMTDMAALLYRAELAGVPVAPERWRAVSDYARERFPKPGLAFVDMHAALAHAIAGDGESLARIIRDARGPAAPLVRDVAAGFEALAAGAWAEASNHLTDAMADHARFGGSRAQRDLLEFALAGVLLRDGRAGEARRLLRLRRPQVDAAKAVSGLGPAA